MCWKDPAEFYNDGQAFKLCARDASEPSLRSLGTTNGYCKKVKTQISFAANLFGLAEEGARRRGAVFPRYDLAGEYDGRAQLQDFPHRIAEVRTLFADDLSFAPRDTRWTRNIPTIICVPETARFALETQTITWESGGEIRTIKLLLDHHYLLPSGFAIHLEKPVETGPGGS